MVQDMALYRGSSGPMYMGIVGDMPSGVLHRSTSGSAP
jgi:hypothetical protein